MHSIPYLQREPYRRRYTHQHPQQAHYDPSLVQSRHDCWGALLGVVLSLTILEATAFNMANMPKLTAMEGRASNTHKSSTY